MKILSIACLLTVTAVALGTKDCFVAPCKLYGKQTTCFQVGCKKAGLTSECHLNIVSTTQPVEKEPGCIAVNKVPGFLEFCQEMVNNASLLPPAPPVDISKFSTTPCSSPSTTMTIKESKLVKDDVCYGTTIIVSVAVGCYLVGTFFTWLMLCCCKVNPCCKRAKKTDEFLTVPNETPRRHPLSRGRDIGGSTSSAQLLSNGSMETLSTHVTNDGRHTHGSLPNGMEPASCNREPSSRVALWASSNRPPHPNIQWIENGRPSYPHPRTNITQWPDSVYAPVSESSSRDYQSILGGSENHYVPASESSSDYSGIQTHKVSIIRDGEIYQASSESSGNDYTSLKGQRFGSSRVNDTVYYPASDSSYKDYATLNTEAEQNANVREETKNVKVKGADRTATFNVSALDLPTPTGSRSWRNKELQDINEYEVVEDDEGFVTVNSTDTLADMCSNTRESVDLSTPQLHEYFKLDPM